jgi:hypothetical protein
VEAVFRVLWNDEISARQVNTEMHGSNHRGHSPSPGLGGYIRLFPADVYFAWSPFASSSPPRFLSGTPNHSFLFSLSLFPCDTENEQLEGALGQIREQCGQLPAL